VVTDSKDDPLGRAGAWKVPPRKEPEPQPEPGEFTRIFRHPTESAEPVQPAQTDAQSTVPPDDSSKAPGEFTRMFSAPSVSSPPAAKPTLPLDSTPPPPPLNATTNDPPGFTKVFQAYKPPAQNWQPEPARAAIPALPNVSSISDPVITRQVEAVVTEPMQTVSEATRIFNATPQPEIIPQQLSGPSEFTRMISVPTLAPPLETDKPAPVSTTEPNKPAQPEAPIKPSYLPLILVLNGLFVLTVIIVLYFAFKK
jgi:hypothetical protein